MKSNSSYVQGFREGLKPDPIMPVPVWAEKYRVLSTKSSSEAGPWRNSRTPYLIEPMTCMSAHHAAEEVVLMFGAQLGKTESMLNNMGHIIHHSPGPAMMVQPTTDMAKKFSRQRIEPLFNDTEPLKERVSESKSRDSSNTILSKDFTGGMLIITGANSAAGLASTPVRFLMLDEIDRYPHDVDGEGAPVDLAEARTRTFSMRKIIKTSTPTTKGSSEIERAYLGTDQRKYFVPCPHCKVLQVLDFKNLQWEKARPETVLYYCPECGEGIPEYKKTWMLDPENGAEWRATAKADPRKIGFHLSSLYSPVGWLSWKDIADKWEKAQSSDTKLRAFINTILAETWQLKGEAPDWQRLYDQREDYQIGVAPLQVAAITMGVDIQGDRIEAHVIGWGRNGEKWTVDYQVLAGDTSNVTKSGPWGRLSELIQKDYPHASGSTLRIMGTAIDSGYNTQIVYDFVRKHSHLKVYAIKGQENLPLVIGSPKDVDIKLDGRIMYRGTKYWPVGVNVIKPDIYGWLKRELPTEEEILEQGYPTGFFHFPEMSEDWFKQLTSEQLVPVVINGYKRNRWQKVYDRNEVLDTAVYGVAIAYLVGIPSWTDERWMKQESLVGARGVVVRESDEIQVEKKKIKKKRERVESDDFDIDIDIDI